MASDEESKVNFQENFDWNVENEIKLFDALIGHKPVGINKHFHMACVLHKFESLIGSPVTPDTVWKHLGTMFDLEALDKKEILAFPNEPEEFALPESEFSDLIKAKLSSKLEATADTKETAKETKTPGKTVKDTSSTKESANSKKEKKSDGEENSVSNENDKKDNGESETETKKGKGNKDEKPNKRRGARTKDKKDEDTPTTPTTTSKKEEDTSGTASGQKKEKQGVGKRSLRSRADDSLLSKSLTPPPVKRTRRT